MVKTMSWKTKTISLAMILSMTLGSVAPARCFSATSLLPQKKHVMMTTAALTVAGMLIFLSRRPGSYELRFDKETLNTAWKDKDSKNIFKQIVNYVSDLIGCKGSSSSIKVVKNGDKLDLAVSEGAKPVGLGGHVHANMKPVLGALGTFVAYYKLKDGITNSVDAIKEFALWDDYDIEISE